MTPDNCIRKEFINISHQFFMGQVTPFYGPSGRAYHIEWIPSSMNCAPTLCLVCRKINPKNFEVYWPQQYRITHESKEFVASSKLKHEMDKHPETADPNDKNKLTQFFKDIVN